MNNETYNMLERAAQVQLEAIENLDVSSKEGKEVLTKSVQLVELLVSADKIYAECEDKDERRRIEEEKNKAMDKTERRKQEITWQKVLFELAKLAVPLGISMFGYDKFQKRMLKFEETGRICSSAGRELHLPKFFK